MGASFLAYTIPRRLYLLRTLRHIAPVEATLFHRDPGDLDGELRLEHVRRDLLLQHLLRGHLVRRSAGGESIELRQSSLRRLRRLEREQPLLRSEERRVGKGGVAG